MKVRCCIRAAAGVLILGACAIARPDIDSLLPREPASTVSRPLQVTEAQPPGAEPAAVDLAGRGPLTVAELGQAILRRLDQEAALLRQVAREQPEDVPAQLAASHALFLSAEARVLCASLDRMDRLDREGQELKLIELIELEDHLPSDVHAEVLALGEEGLAFSERALELAPSQEARQIRATHLSLIAWARGPARAFLRGDGRELQTAIDELLEVEASEDGGASRRLAGRLRSRAPWPYRDRELAGRYLSEAVEASSIPIHYFFLGDNLALQGETEKAAAHWRLALELSPGEGMRASHPLRAELIARRLERVEPQQQQ